MTLEYDNIFDVTSASLEQASRDKKRSDLMVKIHEVFDCKSAPIKNTVNTLGITPSQARNLIRGDIVKFTEYELETFLHRVKLSTN
tara:strand:- start:5066 stop:5323 length:258 start_codon:yes stop_codon:yes gene_type:complete